MSDTYIYTIEDAIYINLTNKCTNRCSFCVRESFDGVEGYDLWLDKEPSAKEIIDQIAKYKGYQKAVFCGYGEPMMRLEELKEVAHYLKENGYNVRINTNGQANLVYKRNVVPELENLIDTVSISLNAPDAYKYNEICNSIYNEEAFTAVIDFTKECNKYIEEVILSVVDIISTEDIERCREIAKETGAKFRVRNMIE